ncbi:hypothetical protein [Rhizosphaericola mali]|uniref:Uncharacterized protein n=1 Tax=Rhizosphaericola mali TaxID=2545455 RepID=A0A5P2FWZ1_9BACT|nr:hypothetical protein [Rhizosphaericola mali]QES88036.1 hypothetical protein E0W69_004945 [Rhizosphaericola mali]
MNLSEVELVLKDLVKEVQETKALMEKAEVPKEQNEISDSLSYSLRILPKKMDRLHSIIDMAFKKQFQNNGSDKSGLFEQLKLSLERNMQQLKNPEKQKIQYEHSFKDWKWLLVLFLFIGSTVVLGWYALYNYYASRELTVKHSFTQKMMPRFTHWMDSLYTVNPAFMKTYQIPETKITKPKERKAKKKQKKR